MNASAHDYQWLHISDAYPVITHMYLVAGMQSSDLIMK